MGTTRRKPLLTESMFKGSKQRPMLTNASSGPQRSGGKKSMPPLNLSANPLKNSKNLVLKQERTSQARLEHERR